MTQTHDGYLWLGTINGLVRFDGSHFAVFDESVTPRLGSSAIVRLFEDRDHNLWIGTATDGAMLVRDGRVIPLDFGRGSREDRLIAVCQDSIGAVWLLTRNQLGRYWQGEINVWNIPTPCRTLAAEPNGRVWLGADAGMTGIDPATVHGSDLGQPVNLPVQANFLLASKDGGLWRLVTHFENGAPQSRIEKWRGDQLEKDFGPFPWNVPVADIRTAVEDLDGNLIVGLLNEGIYWFDAQGNWTHLSDTNGLSINSVLSMQMDADGNLWVGLDGASREGGPLNCVRRPSLKLIKESASQVIQSVAKDARGDLWFSSASSGVNRIWTNGLAHIPSVPGLLAVNPGPLLIDSNQTIWLGVFGGGLLTFQDGAFRPAPGANQVGPWIYALHQDRQGTIWAGTINGLSAWDGQSWKTYSADGGLPVSSVRAIADDRQGNLWIGGERGGLACLRDGHFTAYQRTNGFPTDSVSSLWVDDADTLWIGAAANGVIRMQNGAWTHFTRHEGLTSDIIDYITDDNEGYLWAGSDWGLMRVPKSAFKNPTNEDFTALPCRLFDERDGLPSIDCTVRAQPAALRARDGLLYLPTIAGIVSADPVTLRARTNAPPVVIESVFVEDHNQDTNDLPTVPLRAVTVPAGKDQIRIEYASLNIGASDRSQFRYILENHDHHWTEAHNSRSVLYNGLPPGEFTFRVIASSQDGIWDAGQPGATIAIKILPQFWQTASFRLASLILLIALVSAFVFYISTQRLQRQVSNLRQQQALENERARIARDIHDQVGASLTQISLLGEMVESDKDEPAEVEAHGKQLSQTARETARALDEIVWTVNPRNDTLEGLVNYICKHAQDYLGVANVRYRIDVPTALPEASISPEARHNVFLAAKEAVTNVVKHARASEAAIRLRLEPARFILEIEDNGRGLANLDPKTMRNGLRNMRKRMEDIGGSFDLAPGPDNQGAIVRLTVPLNHQPAA